MEPRSGREEPSRAGLSRRALAGRVGAAALALAAAPLVMPGGAAAFRTWCRADPVLEIDGELADVFVDSVAKMLLAADGPVRLEIALPPGVTGRVLLSDAGFGRGYDIEVAEGNRPALRIAVFAPAGGAALPVVVTFAPRSLSAGLEAVLVGTSAEGLSDEWVKLTAERVVPGA
jgi:hypothetical protein